MKSPFTFAIVLLSILTLIIGTSFASVTSNSLTPNTLLTSNTQENASISTTNLSISSALTSNTFENLTSLTANQLNMTVAVTTFDKTISPFSLYLDVIVVTIFVIILLYGAMIIYSREFDPDITGERKLKMLFEYAVGAGMVLFLIPYIYAYVNYFPKILEATAPKLFTINSMVPIYILWIDIFVSVLISLVGFLLAIREYIRYIKTYQTGGTGNKTATEAERSQIFQRLFALTIFMFVSPFILGIVFVTITQIFFSISITISSNLINVSSASHALVFPFYQTNLAPGCGIFHIACTIYAFADAIYGVGFQASVFNAIVSVMTSTWGDLPLFMLLYDLMVLVLMVYSFAKIDWYSLQYISSLKTGEQEARNYNKLKNSFMQYVMFLLSPIMFVIAIIALNTFVTVMLSIITNSKLSLVPPLVNLAGTPTVENLFLSVAGDIMALFGLALLLVVIIVALLKILGGIIFAFGVFLYFSEDARNRMFGKNLLILFVILYIAPLIIILLYSLFFGLLPSLISQGLGYGHSVAVATSLGGYHSTTVSNSTTEIKIYGNNTVWLVNCVNRTQVNNAIKTLSGVPDSADALGVLLGSCQNFVGYWANGYEIVAILSMVLIIISIIGLPAIATAFSGFMGLGGGVSGAVSLTKGIQGKPLKEKLSQIAKNVAKNRKNFIDKMRDRANKQNKTLRGFVASSLANKVTGSLSKVGSVTMRGANTLENLTYEVVSAPIAGTALGSVLDTARTGTKKLLSNVIRNSKEEIKGGQSKYLSKKQIEDYAKSHKKKGESDEQAIERFKRMLREKYGASGDRYGNYRISKRNLDKLQNDLRYKFSVPKHFYNEAIEETAKERNSEIEKIKSHYEEAITKAKKSGNIKEVERLRKEEKEKIDEIKNRYASKLDEVAKKEHFEDYNSYLKLKQLSSDIDAITDPDTYIRKRIDEAREKEKERIIRDYEKKGIKLTPQQLSKKVDEAIDKNSIIEQAQKELKEKKANLTEALKKHGLFVNPLTHTSKDLEDILKNDPDDLRSIAYVAFDSMRNSNDVNRAFSIMAKAISTKEPDIGYKMKVALGNVGKEMKFEYLNPMVGAIGTRFRTTKEIIGDLKNYAFISGIPVYAQYDNKIKEYEEKINDLVADGSKYLNIIKDPEASPEAKIEAQMKIKEIDNELATISNEKSKIESKKNAIDHMSLIPKAILKGEIVPSFASYIKLVSSDEAKKELGIIEIKRQMLENEKRILEKNIDGYKADLKVAESNLQRTDLTDYQKLQYEKIINELNAKIEDMEASKNVISNTITDINKMIKEKEQIKKAQSTSDSIFTDSTVEAQIYEKYANISKRDPLLITVNELQNKIKQAEELTNAPAELGEAISNIVKNVSDAIAKKKVSKLDINELKLTPEEATVLSSIATPELLDYKGKIDTALKAVLHIKEGNIKEAEKTVKDLINEHRLYDIINDSVVDSLSSTFEEIKSNQPRKDRSLYDNLLQNIVSKVREADIKGKEDAKKIIDSVIKESEMKDTILNNKALYEQITNLANFEETYKQNILNTLAEYMQKNAQNIDGEMEEISKDLNKNLKNVKESAKNFMSKYGVDDLNLVAIGRYFTSDAFKETITQTEKLKFDFEVLQNKIQNILHERALELELSEKEIEKISSFDPDVVSEDNPALSAKYMKVLENVVIPELKNAKYNKVAEIMNRAIRNIQSGHYEERERELDALAITTLTTDLARSIYKLERLMTSKKNEKVGMKRGKFGVLKLVKKVNEEKEENPQNEEKEETERRDNAENDEKQSNEDDYFE